MGDAPANKLVSVIIPTFNRAALLREAVESVFAQTHRPIEIIIVDDGSTDGTGDFVQGEMMRRASGEEMRIHYLPQTRVGASRARNAGLSKSSGGFVQFLDSDDVLHPQKLARSLQVFERSSETDCVVSEVGDWRERGGDGSAAREAEFIAGEQAACRLLARDFVTMAPLHRRAALAAIGGFKGDLSLGEDVDLHLRLALAGGRFCLLPDVLSYQRTHSGDRLSNQNATMPLEFEQRFYRDLLAFAQEQGRCGERFKRAIADRLVRIGLGRYGRGMPAIGRGCLVEARAIESASLALRERLYLLPGGGGVAVAWQWAGRARARIWRMARELCGAERRGIPSTNGAAVIQPKGP